MVAGRQTTDPRATGLPAGRLHKPNREDLVHHLTNSLKLNQGYAMGVSLLAALGLMEDIRRTAQCSVPKLSTFLSTRALQVAEDAMQAVGYLLTGIYMQRGVDQHRPHHTRCRLIVECH